MESFDSMSFLLQKLSVRKGLKMNNHIFCTNRLLLIAVVLTASCISTASPCFAAKKQTMNHTCAQKHRNISEGKNIPTSAKTPVQTNIVVTVSWEDDDDRDRIRPESIDLYLMKNGSAADRKAVTAKENWTCAFTTLPLCDRNGNEIMYCVAENSIPGYSISQNKSETEQSHRTSPAENIEYSFINKRDPSTTTVTVRTSWNDSMDHEKLRPQQTMVQLYADDKPCGRHVLLNKENNWCCRFKDLPLNSNGKHISYTVAQEYVPDEYQESLSVSEEGDFLIENRHDAAESVSDDSSDMTQISGCVRWEDSDDQDGLRPNEIEVLLYADGRQIARKDVSSADSWFYSFDNLPKYTDGTEIIYSVQTGSINGYQSLENNCSLTCIHDPETIDLQGKVEWAREDESSSLRPQTISLSLLSDQETLKTIKVSETDNWTFSVPSLPKYHAGNVIDYSLEPDSCAGYQASVDGMTVTYTQIAPAVIPDPDIETLPLPESKLTGDQLPEPASFLPLFPIFFLILAASPAFMFRKRNRKRPGRRH